MEQLSVRLLLTAGWTSRTGCSSSSRYRKARDEMQELVRAQKNVERFFAEEKETTEKTQTR